MFLPDWMKSVIFCPCSVTKAVMTEYHQEGHQDNQVSVLPAFLVQMATKVF